MGCTTERVQAHSALFLYHLSEEESRMKFNGTIILLEKAQTLNDFVTGRGFDAGRIAAELNGDIIPRKEYGNVLLKDEDTLEVVRFVGGG
jgi:sulfur carrier protein